MDLIPTKKQWRAWSLPSKLTAMGTLIGLVSLLVGLGSLFPFGNSELKQTEIVATSNGKETPCKSFSYVAANCSICFDGGAIKVSEDIRPFLDMYIPVNYQDTLYFKDENKIVYTVKTLNLATKWFTSNNLLEYPDEFVWHTAEQFLDRQIHFQYKDTRERYLQTKPNKAIRLISSNSPSQSSVPDFMVRLDQKYRNILERNPIQLSEMKTISSCIFYYAEEP